MSSTNRGDRINNLDDFRARLDRYEAEIRALPLNATEDMKGILGVEVSSYNLGMWLIRTVRKMLEDYDEM